LLGLPKFGLGLNTIAQLNECKDLLLMAVGTMDAKTKSSEIDIELELIHGRADNFLKILGNLSASGRFLLEKELNRPVQKKSINVCPFCMENLKKISLKDHLIQCKCLPDQVDMIKEVPVNEDLIDRCYSDTNRILLAADKAIKKKKDLLKNRGGRPRLTGYKEGIFKVCKLFINNSIKYPSNYYTPGLKEFEGHLFKFVEFFISRISPLPEPSSYSLGQIIREFKHLPKKSSRRKK
jgi:hypothetical protein